MRSEMRAWVFARSSTIPKKNEGLIDGLVTVNVQYIFEVKRVFLRVFFPLYIFFFFKRTSSIQRFLFMLLFILL